MGRFRGRDVQTGGMGVQQFALQSGKASARTPRMSSLPPHLSLEMADELADGRMLKSCQMGSRGVENG